MFHASYGLSHECPTTELADAGDGSPTSLPGHHEPWPTGQLDSWTAGQLDTWAGETGQSRAGGLSCQSVEAAFCSTQTFNALLNEKLMARLNIQMRLLALDYGLHLEMPVARRVRQEIVEQRKKY